MGGRDDILKAVTDSQPNLVPLPDAYAFTQDINNEERFRTVLETIGGKAYTLDRLENLSLEVRNLFPDAKRIVSTIASVDGYFPNNYQDVKHQSFHDVDVVVIEARIGVAENGSVWITEEDSKIRVLPFIPEHLVVVLKTSQIVPTMHDAYNTIGSADYGFGVFIAGPSKTADIEQSLVLGAHGPKSMTLFLLDKEQS